MPRPPLPYAFLDGEFVASGDATVSVFDRGFLFGDGVYEVVPVYGGNLFHADLHLDRLHSSLSGIRLGIPWDMEWLANMMADLVQRNGGGDQSLYLQITRGAEHGRDHLFPAEGTRPTLFMYSTATPPRNPTVDREGLKVIVAVDFRWEHCHLKVTSLLANVLLKNQAVAEGADEVILQRGGRLTEASISNIYIVRDGTVFTPELTHELLPGVTRVVVLDLCRLNGIPFIEQDLTTLNLDGADEIWISSSTRELAPITMLGGQPVGDGKPGPVYAKVRAAFDDLIAAWRHDTTTPRRAQSRSAPDV